MFVDTFVDYKRRCKTEIHLSESLCCCLVSREKFVCVRMYISLLTYKILVVWGEKRVDMSRCKFPKRCKQDEAMAHVGQVERNDSLSPLCQRCRVGWEFPSYLGRLVRNTLPWLQKSRGGGEPDAEQTRRISSPWEKARDCGCTTTEGASAVEIKGRQKIKKNKKQTMTQGLVTSCMMSFIAITSLTRANLMLWAAKQLQKHSMSDFITTGYSWRHIYLPVCWSHCKYLSAFPQ